MPFINSTYAPTRELSWLESQTETEPDKPWGWVLCSKPAMALHCLWTKAQVLTMVSKTLPDVLHRPSDFTFCAPPSLCHLLFAVELTPHVL